jgi:hypothetical protein
MVCQQLDQLEWDFIQAMAGGTLELRIGVCISHRREQQPELKRSMGAPAIKKSGRENPMKSIGGRCSRCRARIVD